MTDKQPLVITDEITIPESELDFQFIRAQGAGGQHVNKASTAVHLRFDFLASEHMPDDYKKKLLATKDQRISKDGVIVIKAQKFRSQEKNKEDAIQRLAEMIRAAGIKRKKRRPTKPTKASRQRRLEKKSKTAQTKKLRKSVRRGDY